MPEIMTKIATENYSEMLTSLKLFVKSTVAGHGATLVILFFKKISRPSFSLTGN